MSRRKRGIWRRGEEKEEGGRKGLNDEKYVHVYLCALYHRSVYRYTCTCTCTFVHDYAEKYSSLLVKMYMYFFTLYSTVEFTVCDRPYMYIQCTCTLQVSSRRSNTPSLFSMRSMQGWLSVKLMNDHSISSLTYSACSSWNTCCWTVESLTYTCTTSCTYTCT